MQQTRKPTHPGVAFKELAIIPGEKSIDLAAKRMGFDHAHDLRDILDGNKKVTQNTANKFGEYSKTSPESWLSMQTKLDEWENTYGQCNEEHF